MAWITETTRARFERAGWLYEQENWNEARQTLSALLAEEPDLGPAHELLGLIASAQGLPSEAQQHMETASLLAPLSVAGQMALGDCYLEHGFRDAARAVFEHLANLDDLPADCLGPLAAQLGRLGLLHMALEVCRRATFHFPEAAEPLMGLAWYMGKLNYPPELIVNLLRRAVSLAPERIGYRLTLVRLLCTIDRAEEAHRLIVSISTEQLQSVRCAGCLRQLAPLFDAADDPLRAEICRQRAAELSDDHCAGQPARRRRA